MRIGMGMMMGVGVRAGQREGGGRALPLAVAGDEVVHGGLNNSLTLHNGAAMKVFLFQFGTLVFSIYVYALSG